VKKIYLSLLSVLMLQSCGVQNPFDLETYNVVVRDKYDVVVGKQPISGEDQYFVNGISLWTDKRPPMSLQQEIYIEAIELASNCNVIDSSIRWEDAGILQNAIMRAAVKCS